MFEKFYYNIFYISKMNYLITKSNFKIDIQASQLVKQSQFGKQTTQQAQQLSSQQLEQGDKKRINSMFNSYKIQKIQTELKNQQEQHEIIKRADSATFEESNFSILNLDPFQVNIPKIILIQSYIRTRKVKKTYLILKKQHRYRRNVILEIINTERSYVQDLSIVINAVIIPLKNNVIISESDQSEIFSNLVEIRELNSVLLERLESKLLMEQNLKQNLPYLNICEEIRRVSSLFSIYFTYCKSYEQASKKRAILRKEITEFNEFLTKAEKSPQFRSLDLEGFLVKPVQRLPKYVLLLKDLLKHTSKDHPDYDNIEKSLKAFEDINDQNNKVMDQFIRETKMKELQSMFGDQKNHQIIREGRTFILEANLNLFVNFAERISAQLYLLTDLIIIFEKLTDHHHLIFQSHNSSSYKLRNILYLNEISQCKKMPETKLCKTMFKVVGKNATEYLIAENQEQYENLTQEIENAIRFLAKRKGTKFNQHHHHEQGENMKKLPVIEVSVLGTEERDIGSLNNYTVYIIQIVMKNLIQKVYMRYSEIESLYNYCSKLDIRLVEFAKISWIQNKSSKLLEQRKIQIEGFVQTILSNPQIQKNPNQILKKMGLPQNFFTLYLALEDEAPNLRLSHKSSFGDIENFNLNQIRSKYEQYSQKYFKKLSEADCLKDMIDIDQKELKNIQVYLLSGEIIVVTIDSQMKGNQVCQAIAKKIGLVSYVDFKLFIVDKNENTRVLEDDQMIMKSLPQQSKNIYIANEGKFLSKFINFFKKPFEDDQLLVFKKYITLSTDEEESEYKLDPKRLELIVAEEFYKIFTNQYIAYFLDYCIFSALYVYIQLKGQQDHMMNFPFQLIQHVIPNYILKNKTDSEWKVRRKITQIILYFDSKITEIQEYNAEYEKAQMEQDFHINYDLFKSKEQLAQMIMINTMQNYEIFGYTLFYVEIRQKTKCSNEKHQGQVQPIIFNQGIKIAACYLGVYYKGIKLIGPTRKETLYQLDYDAIFDEKKSIDSVKANPNSIQFKDRIHDKYYRFKTQQSYDIFQLMNEYYEISKYK